MALKAPRDLLIVGWREWISLPGLGIEHIKVKSDTGARSSSLHAFDVHHFEKEGKAWVRFTVHPLQRNDRRVIHCESELLEMRNVRSSNGEASSRPVILTPISIGGQRWNIELTLAVRDQMGFRMLLGREALRGRALVDPARSYVASHGVVERAHRYRRKGG